MDFRELSCVLALWFAKLETKVMGLLSVVDKDSETSSFICRQDPEFASRSPHVCPYVCLFIGCNLASVFSFSYILCVCTCVCVYVHMYMCVFMCIWRPEENVKYCFSGTVHLVLETGLLIGLGLTS